MPTQYDCQRRRTGFRCRLRGIETGGLEVSREKGKGERPLGAEGKMKIEKNATEG